MKLSRTGRIFLYVSIAVALIDILFVYINVQLSKHSFEMNMKAESESLYQNYQTLLTQNYSNLLTIATFIANDPQVQELFYNGQQAVKREGGGAGGPEAQRYRNELYGLVGQKWAAVQKKFSARQLHFHLGPGSTSFLRVHKPEKFGDNMDKVRFTIVDANDFKQPVTGFETGRVYSGLRGVVPVMRTNPVTGIQQHIGALEVGTSFDVILNILHQTSNYAAGVLLTQNHIEGAMWPEAIKRKFGQQNNLCECVIEAASEDNFSAIIAAGRDKGIRFRDGGHELVNIADNNFLISYFPLRDYRGSLNINDEDVGAVVFWKNVDGALSELRSSQIFNIVYGIIGFFIVELLFYLGFRFGTVRLQKAIRHRTQELKINQDRLAEAQKMALVGNWEWHIESGELWWSDQVYKLFQLDPATTKPTIEHFMSYVHQDDKEQVQDQINRALSARGRYSVEHRLCLPSGHEIQVLEQGFVESDTVGKPVRMKGTVQDISTLKRAEQRLADVIWATGVGIWEWNVPENSLITNEKWANLSGYSSSELSPLSLNSWEMLIYQDDLPAFRQEIAHLVDNPDYTLNIELRVRHRNGNLCWLLVKGRCVERSKEGKAIRISGSSANITQRKEDELKIHKLATTDELTGLNNRSVFIQRLNELAKLTDRTGQPFSLIFIDLDGFKPINDQFGHPTGDKLLQDVARDLKQSARETDIAARLGGDEFAIILTSASDISGAETFAKRLLQTLSRQRIIEGQSIQISASIGCSLYTCESATAEDLIKSADQALYQAKYSGKNTVVCSCAHPETELETSVRV